MKLNPCKIYNPYDRGIKFTRNFFKLRYTKMIGEKEGIRKYRDISWILSSSDPILIPHVIILKLEKCLVNSNFSSKGRVRKFSHKMIKFAKKEKKKSLAEWGKKRKIKSHSWNYIPHTLNGVQKFWKKNPENSFNNLVNT